MNNAINEMKSMINAGEEFSAINRMIEEKFPELKEECLNWLNSDPE